MSDLFVANEIVGKIKFERLLVSLERAKVRVGVDSIAVAEPLGEAAASRGVRVPVMVEFDTGHGRAGARSVAEAVVVARSPLITRDSISAGAFTRR